MAAGSGHRVAARWWGRAFASHSVLRWCTSLDSRQFPVRIGAGDARKFYSVEFQSAAQFSVHWRRVLQRAHGGAELWCSCPGSGAKRLAVRHHRESDSYVLARFPETGHEHAPECGFYAPDMQRSGMAAYAPGVVQGTSAGKLKVRLAVSLQPSSAEDASANGNQGGDAGVSAMSLRGLLHFLWTQARLNCWSPAMDGKRSVDAVHAWVRKAAMSIQVGREPLAPVLLAATMRERGAAAAGNGKRVAESLARQRRLIVVAPLAGYSRERSTFAFVPLYGFHGIPRLRLGVGEREKLERQFAAELSAWRLGAKLVSISLVDPPASQPNGGTPVSQVVDIALERLTDRWIPVESARQARTEEALFEQKRRFEKPLRFDAGPQLVLQEFLLR